jgi:hypothetical protein
LKENPVNNQVTVSSYLGNNSVFDVAVDGTKFFVHHFLSADDHIIDLLANSLDLVATLGDDVGKVAASSSVPGEDLKTELESMDILLGGSAYVGSVRRNIRQSTCSANCNQALLQLLGSDLSNSESGVAGGLQREVVGQKTSNVRRSHRGTGDGVDGVLAADPGGQNVQTRGKDVIASTVVREVSTLVSQGGGSDGDGLLGGSRRVVARVGVVVTSSDSKVNTSIHSSVNCLVKGDRLAAAETHVGSASFEALDLSSLGILDFLDVLSSSPLNTGDDIGHRAGAVGTQNLDSVDVGLLGNTVLLASNGSSAVGTVSVAIFIGVTSRNSLTPGSAALKVNVLGVGAGVNDVDIHTLTAVSGIKILVEGSEAQRVSVRDTGQTPRGILLNRGVFHGVDERVLLDVLDLWD